MATAQIEVCAFSKKRPRDAIVPNVTQNELNGYTEGDVKKLRI